MQTRRPVLASVLHLFRSLLAAPPGDAAARRRRTAAAAVLLAAASLAAVDQIFDLVQRKLIYHPQHSGFERKYAAELLTRTRKDLAGLSYEVVDMEYVVPSWFASLGLGGGLRQRAYLLMPSRADAGVRDCKRLWMVQGGNAMWSPDWLPFVTGILRQGGAQQGLCFLLLDYPGYRDNEGTPSAGSALCSGVAAVGAAVKQLAERGTFPAALGFWGHSLGCAASAQLAARLACSPPCWLLDDPSRKLRLSQPMRLVLSAPFTSIPDVGRALLVGNVRGAGPFIALAEATSRHRWDNVHSIRALAVAASRGQVPAVVHIVHGTKDEIVPVHMGRSLHRLCEAIGLHGCTFTERPGASHNDVLEEAFGEYTRLVLAVDEDRRPARM